MEDKRVKLEKTSPNKIEKIGKLLKKILKKARAKEIIDNKRNLLLKEIEILKSKGEGQDQD